MRMACVALLVHRGDPDIEMTTDPLGEIRVFVYKQKTVATQVASPATAHAVDAVVEEPFQHVQLKHTVAGERSLASECCVSLPKTKSPVHS